MREYFVPENIVRKGGKTFVNILYQKRLHKKSGKKWVSILSHIQISQKSRKKMREYFAPEKFVPKKAVKNA